MTVTGPLKAETTSATTRSVPSREGQSYDDLPTNPGTPHTPDRKTTRRRQSATPGAQEPREATQHRGEWHTPGTHHPSTKRSRRAKRARASSTTAGQPPDNPRPPAVAGPSSKRLRRGVAPFPSRHTTQRTPPQPRPGTEHAPPRTNHTRRHSRQGGGGAARKFPCPAH